MRISMTRWVWPDSSPLRQSFRRERLKYQASPVAMVRASASAFICATMSSSPDCASVATQVTSPSASNFGVKARPSSSSLVEPGAANADESATGALSRGRSALAHQAHESDLLGRIVAERTDELGRDRGRAELLDPAQRHAHVLGLDHHGNAARIEDLLDRGRDLRGHVLLGLQASRIDVDEARELGEPDHAIDRLVGDMRLAHEWHHVMLALAIEGDVAHQHEVVVSADLVEGAVEHLGRALAIAAVELLIGIDDALGGLDQALACGVIARKGDQRAHRGFRLLARGAHDLRGYSLDVIAQGCLAQRLDDGVHDGLSVRPVPQQRTGGVTGAAASALGAIGINIGVNPMRRPDAAFPISGGPLLGLYYIGPILQDSPSAKGTAGLRHTNLAPTHQPLYIPPNARRNCREQPENRLPEP